jgi:spermidine synthase
MPGVERVDLYEIARSEWGALTQWERRGTHREVQEFLKHPRIKTSFTDGRLALRIEPARYDVIEADPAEPQMAYSGNLYSLEFYLEARRRLSANGVFCTEVTSARVADTVKAAFPFVLDIRWADARLMLGSNTLKVVDADLLRARLRAADVRASFRSTPRGAELWTQLEAAAGTLRIESIGPDLPRSMRDLNTDLFPRDEFDWRLPR